MKIQKGFLAFLLYILLPVVSAAQTVQQDDTYRMGKLKNGLTYYIRHNGKEPGIADFYIAQRVGSILEEPRQRGLAHFLEHMAFNGTVNYPGKDGRLGIVPWCETVGIKFGTNLNAYTSVDQTVYNISSVPVKREEILDSTLLILHDWSHYLLLTDKEIDKERGVIHEEWRTRRAGKATQRMLERVLPIVYQGTKYADCLPIGSMDIVDRFPYKDLRDYYQKWYRPDLQAIIVVGDIDVARIETKIKQLFGSIPMPKNPAKRVYYPVTDNERMIVAVDKDREQPIILASLYMKHAATSDDQKVTVRYLRDGYIENLVASMLNERLSELQHRTDPPVLSATARTGQFLVSRTKDAFSLSFGCRQENIRGSFDAVLTESERARRYGFTSAELQRAKAIRLKAAERLFKERDMRKNGYYVRTALSHFLEAEPMLSAEENLRLITQFDSQVTLADVNAAAKALISDRNQVLTVYAPDKEELHIPTAAEFEKYVLDAQARTYTSYQESAVPKELMTERPTPGRILSEQDYGKHGVKVLKLSNGVEVYVKQTDYNKDQITMHLYANGGTSLYPDSDVVNFPLITNVVKDAGVGRFNASTLRKMLASKVVNVWPSIDDRTQSIEGSSSVRDLKTMMELTYLYFMQPRKDSIAFRSLINRMRSFLTNREANPQVAYNDSLLAILYGNSPRVQPMKRASLERVSYDRMMQIYRERFSDASGFKMLLIGNVDLDTLRPLLCRYIASLPAMHRKETAADTYPSFRNADETRLFRKKMETPSALVSIFYPFSVPFTAKNDLILDVLKRVLTIAYTDSVREEKGGTYGVSVGSSLEKDAKPTAMVRISFRTAPAKYADLIPIVYRQVENLALKGPNQASLNKVKAFLLKAYSQNIITNEYWYYILYNELRNGVDFHTDYESLLKSISPADIKQMAHTLLNAHRRIEITMMAE